ncbi:IclR family transcriptional regulator [Halocalculus aciditolerans]|uniref:IclR family transcriptional regulator n=1 Tax=Halocalculus aciditolerans TaxID=1383812 RepID=A0A830FL28_9EURY|nr:IclR family transcriptional regulator [Halocalculus aciditolerans]GGL66497.1 IclR family transcriptional regulator [Halocalculus aciditolerans]
MSERAGPTDHVSTVDTAFDILELLREMNGATLRELTDEVDLVRSTVHRHLTTLHDRGYVTRSDGEYSLSLRFLDVGQWTQSRKETYVLAKSKVEELAERTSERAQFVVEENGRAVYVHMEAGEHAVKTNMHVGKHTPVHASAGGLAILSQLDRERVEEIIASRGLERLTPHTYTDPDDLFDALESIRERGFSINDQGHIEGLRAVGVPVSGPDGSVVGALSVSGPTNRIRGDRLENDLPDLLLGSSNELELNSAYR